MYASMHGCIYVCARTHARVGTGMYACMHSWVCMREYACVCLRMLVYARACKHGCILRVARMSATACAWACVFGYARMHACTHACMREAACMYVAPNTYALACLRGRVCLCTRRNLSCAYTCDVRCAMCDVRWCARVLASAYACACACVSPLKECLHARLHLCIVVSFYACESIIVDARSHLRWNECARRRSVRRAWCLYEMSMFVRDCVCGFVRVWDGVFVRAFVSVQRAYVCMYVCIHACIHVYI